MALRDQTLHDDRVDLAQLEDLAIEREDGAIVIALSVLFIAALTLLGLVALAARVVS